MNYELIIWKKGDEFVGEIRELSLLCIDSEPETVVRQLEDEKNKLLREYEELGVVPPGCQSNSDKGANNSGWKVPLGLFAAKTAIVAVATSLILMFAINHTSARVLSIVGGATGPFHYLSVVANKLEALPDDVQEKAMRDLDVIVDGLLPYFDKIRPLSDSTQSQSQMPSEGSKE